MSTPGSLRAALDQLDEIGIADHVQSLEWDRAGARTTDPCPSLHVIAGRALADDGQPRHALGADGRCRPCHTTGGSDE